MPSWDTATGDAVRRRRPTPLAPREDASSEAHRLRSQQIPQRMGMAVGARLLAEDIGREALGRIERARESGALSQWMEGQNGDLGEALAGLLREEMALVVGRLRNAARKWADDSLVLAARVEELEEPSSLLPTPLPRPGTNGHANGAGLTE